MVQCNVEWFDRETNGLKHKQMVQCNVERFNRDTNGLTHRQMVQFNRDWYEGMTKQIVLRTREVNVFPQCFAIVPYKMAEFSLARRVFTVFLCDIFTGLES